MKTVMNTKLTIMLSFVILLIAAYFIFNDRKPSEIHNVTTSKNVPSIYGVNKIFEGYDKNNKYILKLNTLGLKVDGEIINVDSNVKNKIYGWLDTNRNDQYFYEFNTNNRFLNYLHLQDSNNILTVLGYVGSDRYDKRIVMSNVLKSEYRYSSVKENNIRPTKENIDGIYKIGEDVEGDSSINEVMVEFIPPNLIRFKIVVFSPRTNCEGEIDATGIFTNDNTVIFNDDECKLRIIFEWNGKEFDHLIVDEANGCGYHGMRCYFDGLYKKR